MKVLVTGASGRVGRAIHHRLRRDHDVTGLDCVPSPTADLVADLRDARGVARALHGVDAVVHVAALHAPHVGVVADDVFEAVNVAATERLARLSVEHGVERFVFTSTTALYGAASTPRDRAGWVDETTVPQPRSIYHRTKLAAERSLEAIAADGRLAVTVLRMSRCFPEPADLMAAYRLHRGIDARDVASAHAAALGDAHRGFRRFVVSAATPFERDDIDELLRDAPAVLRRRAPDLVAAFARRGWPLPASIDRVYASALAQRRLGWRPRYAFDEVVRMADEGSPEVIPPRRPEA